MKISYNWLKHYVDIADYTPQEIAEILTNSGLEVEGLEKYDSVKGGMEGIVTGKVLHCEKHPNADRLSLTTVDIGTGRPLPIVCGAPNVAEGQKVVVATVGTTLYTGDETLEIKKAKIRGQLSEGMICAEDEVGLGSSHEGIMVLDEDTPVGTPAREYFDIKQDWIFEIGLTPNRTDATAHMGVARDIVASLNQQKKTGLKLKKPSVEGFSIDELKKRIDVAVEDIEACPRYSGLTMMNVAVKESPSWLKNSLNAIGIRPINNVVDVTNFVLMETGHPLHAFDADKIRGDKIVVRKARKGEKFISLDEEERRLLEQDLMICDSSEGMCIAGVFGGIGSGVNEKTRNVFIESAYFDPFHIRKTSRHHGLQTDASFRFERGADPNMTIYALKRAAMMIREISGGEITSDVVDVYPNPVDPWTVSINLDRINTLIGQKLDKDTVTGILNDLEIKIVRQKGRVMDVRIPTFRHDVRREADVVEEILRIYGYNNIRTGEKLHASLSHAEKPDRGKMQNIVSDFLSNNGFAEVMNNSLTRSAYTEKLPGFDPDHNAVIYNPLSSDLNVMRQSLLFGILETILYNQNRQIHDLKLFEFGNVYRVRPEKKEHTDPLEKYQENAFLSLAVSGRKNPESWNTPADKSDFYFLKSYINRIFDRIKLQGPLNAGTENPSEKYAYSLRYTLNNKTLAEFGRLSDTITQYAGIKQAVYYGEIHWDRMMGSMLPDPLYYREIPKFPEVRRDLALLVDDHITFKTLRDIILNTGKDLIKSVGLFDVYEGDKLEKGKKSYAVNIIMQDTRKTLTDKMVDALINKALKALEKETGAQIR